MDGSVNVVTFIMAYLQYVHSLVFFWSLDVGSRLKVNNAFVFLLGCNVTDLLQDSGSNLWYGGDEA